MNNRDCTTHLARRMQNKMSECAGKKQQSCEPEGERMRASQQNHYLHNEHFHLQRPASRNQSERRGPSLDRMQSLLGERQQQEIHELKARKIKNTLRTRHPVSQQLQLQRNSINKNGIGNSSSMHMLSRPTPNSRSEMDLRHLSSTEQVQVVPKRNSSWQSMGSHGEGREGPRQRGQQRKQMTAREMKNNEWYLETSSTLPSKDGMRRGMSLKGNAMMSNTLLMKVIETENADGSLLDVGSADDHGDYGRRGDAIKQSTSQRAEPRYSNGSDRNINSRKTDGKRRNEFDEHRRSNGYDRSADISKPDRRRSNESHERRRSNGSDRNFDISKPDGRRSNEFDEHRRSNGSERRERERDSDRDRRQPMGRHHHQHPDSQRRNSNESGRFSQRSSKNDRSSPHLEAQNRRGRNNSDYDRMSPPKNNRHHQHGRDRPLSVEDQDLKYTGHSYESRDSEQRFSGESESKRRLSGDSDSKRRLVDESDSKSNSGGSLRSFIGMHRFRRGRSNDPDWGPVILSRKQGEKHRRSNESDMTNSSLSSDEDVARLKIFAELAPWLEHCRDPIALKKRACATNGSYRRNNNISSNYDPMQDVKAFEMEEKIAEKMMMMTPDPHEGGISQKPNGSLQFIGAVDNMSKICDDFARFFRKMEVNEVKGKGKKLMNDIAKLDDILSSRKKAPLYRSFPKDILQIVRLLPGNDKCCDCAKDCGWSWSVENKESQKNGMYGSPTYGTLLCKDCAFRHITKGEQKPFKGIEVVIPFEDGDWNLPNILAMVEGGNQAIINYIQNHSKKQRRATMAGQHTNRRASLLQTVDSKRSSLPMLSQQPEEDTFHSDFERIYAGKSAASYRAIVQDRTRRVLLKKVLNISNEQ